uniref:LAGLIDADG endonuclease n=1 Tax=Cryphonectria parasitica TaxID=5116 RepID=A0A191MXB4_CRYPA|nr:LAGLIDADG endonuclease [Cryphonectria parasitica]
MNKTTLLRYVNSLAKLPVHKFDYRIKSKLPIYLNDVLLGLLLSDGYLEKSSPTSGARLTVSFGSKHSAYLNFLYKLFEPYTNSEPTKISVLNKKTKVLSEVVRFKTVMLPQLVWYHNLFYSKSSSLANGKLVKIIPSNIMELISPVVLAHLIMGDGNLKMPDKIIRIYTNSFTKSDVELLAKAINKKLGIAAKATLDRNDQYMITISKSQLSLVIAQLKTHMHSSMSYKLGLQPEECVSDVQELKFSELNDFGPDCIKYDEMLKNWDQ